MHAIRADPRIRDGEPCLAGTRVPTRAIWSFWRHGASISHIGAEYPHLSRQQVWCAVLFELRRHPSLLRRRTVAPVAARCRHCRRLLCWFIAAPGSRGWICRRCAGLWAQDMDLQLGTSAAATTATRQRARV